MLQNQLNQRNTEYQTAQEKLQENERVITRLNTQIEEQHKSQIALEKEVNTHKQKSKTDNDVIQNIKVEHEELHEHASKLQESVDQNSKNISELEEKLKTAQTQLEEKNNQTNQLNSQIVQLKNEITKLNTARSKVETTLKSSETEVNSLKTKLKDTELDLDTTKSKLEKSENDLKLAQNELVRYTQEIEGRIAQELEEDKLKWAKDEEIDNCLKCNIPFGVMTRRHHCRICGKIFCQNCSNHKVTMPASAKPVRACDNCFSQNTTKPDWRRLSVSSTSSLFD